MKLVYNEGNLIYKRDNNYIFNNPNRLYMSDRFTTDYLYIDEENQWYKSSSLSVNDREVRIKKSKAKNKLKWTINRVEEVWPDEIERINEALKWY